MFLLCEIRPACPKRVQVWVESTALLVDRSGHEKVRKDGAIEEATVVLEGSCGNLVLKLREVVRYNCSKKYALT